jgi:hypothetical protein
VCVEINYISFCITNCFEMHATEELLLKMLKWMAAYNYLQCYFVLKTTFLKGLILCHQKFCICNRMVGGLRNMATLLASMLKNLFSNRTRFCDCHWYILIDRETDMALCDVTVCGIKFLADCHLSTHHTCISDLNCWSKNDSDINWSLFCTRQSCWMLGQWKKNR